MVDVAQYTGGENFSLRDILLKGRKLNFDERTRFFSQWINTRAARGESLFLRIVSSAAGREVEMIDPITHIPHRMLMFGSNNYLDLTSHPYVRERVKRAVDTYGIGVGGPPLLNGYTKICRELEERLSAIKGKEDTLVFSSGYGTNVGMLSSLVGKHDTVIYDLYSHASFLDGLKMGDAPGLKFAHNDVEELRQVLESVRSTNKGDVFVGVEGVYSMDGDVAPLDKIVPLSKAHGAIMIVDDAHGTGVMGYRGSGTCNHFGCSDDVDIIMGTFSKALGVTGGFVSTTRPVADYLRFFARSYMFSAALSPVIIAAVLAGLDVMEREEHLFQQLRDNTAYLASGLKRLGFNVEPQAPIIPLIVPETMNIRKAAYHFHKSGIFLNCIEYPAVPVSQQRFRISLMASHTRADIDRLLEVIEEVWTVYNLPHVNTRAAASV